MFDFTTDTPNHALISKRGYRAAAAAIGAPRGRVAELESLGGVTRMNDDEFLAAFEARTLEEFHHRDHIKVTFLYLQRHPLDEPARKSGPGSRLWP